MHTASAASKKSGLAGADRTADRIALRISKPYETRAGYVGGQWIS
jgi:hypothetical protein